MTRPQAAFRTARGSRLRSWRSGGQSRPTPSGSAELLHAHNPTYDDSNVRTHLGSGYQVTPALNAANVKHFVRSLSNHP
jgi:hypothetical protein